MDHNPRKLQNPPGATHWIQSWKGFLPARAIVMARKIAAVPLPLPPSDFQIAGCSNCLLCQDRNFTFVGEGDPNSPLIFVGHDPAQNECNALLGRMIEAMGLRREQVWIAQAVQTGAIGLPKTAPQLISPKVIVALGELTSQTLLRTSTHLTELRGKLQPFCKTQTDRQIMPTHHPLDLLNNPLLKRQTWSDLQQVAKALGIQIPKNK